MAQHKWHKEIKAWADGEEIQQADIREIAHPNWYEACDPPNWESTHFQYRVKPQPKEPQYLYAYKVNAKIVELYDELQMAWDGKMLLGKIKLEVDDD